MLLYGFGIKNMHNNPFCITLYHRLRGTIHHLKDFEIKMLKKQMREIGQSPEDSSVEPMNLISEFPWRTALVDLESPVKSREIRIPCTHGNFGY